MSKHDLLEKKDSQAKKKNIGDTITELQLEWDTLIKDCDPFTVDKSILSDFFRKVWPVVIQPVLIDSLFKTDTVEDIIQYVLTLLIRSAQMNLYNKNKDRPLGRSCNRIITGCKNVGKTLLMKGLQLFIEEFCSKFTKVYFIDFSLNPDFISNKLDPPIEGDFTDSNVNMWCQKQKKTLILFGDEFQTLYLKNSKDLKANTNMVRQLLAVGKASLAVGILSGSSAATKSLAHRESTFTSDIYSFMAFEDLNHQCYIELVIPPMRNKEEITTFLSDLKIPTTELNNYMSKTGGVGGQMLDLYNSIYNHKSVVKTLLSWLDTDKKMAFIIRLLFSKNRDNEDRIWNQKSIQWSELPAQLFPHPHSALLEACDSGVLILNQYQAFELLLPSYYDMLITIFKEKPSICL